MSYISSRLRKCEVLLEKQPRNFSIMLIRYGIIAVRPAKDEDGMADILHFCGYEDPPTQFDFDALREELNTNPAFGLQGDMDGVELMEAPEEILDTIMRSTDADDIEYHGFDDEEP